MGIAAVTVLDGCASGESDNSTTKDESSPVTTTIAQTTADATTTTEATTTTDLDGGIFGTDATTTTEDAPPTYPSGDPIIAGYPALVSVSSLDGRLASWMGRSGTTQAVALAPGVYAAYNAAVPDLTEYLTGPVDGDCAVKKHYFPDAAGACWDGVQPGSGEP